MRIIEKVLTDALILKPRVFKDDRGYFYESFNEKVFDSLAGMKVNFIQDNQSYSSKGTLRGLHFQTGDAAQAKLVRVTKGSAYDVAVDLRPNSPTFKQWYGVELSEDNNLQFFIPRGFAHAFVALEGNTIFQYKVDNYYSSTNDGGVIWNDDELAIIWPKLKLELSDKDKNLPKLNQLNLSTLW
ncbi:dTDP-4-dehydrorhamnose 3,5-epimerase [Schleiferiaceae bacterium]|nr:dTDP-4-dehydrorhamnose 3,5-epimerase [Schleiferiaceae bacterium]